MKIALVKEAESKSSDLAALINQLYHQELEGDRKHLAELRKLYSEMSKVEARIEKVSNNFKTSNKT